MKLLILEVRGFDYSAYSGRSLFQILNMSTIDIYFVRSETVDRDRSPFQPKT